MSAGPEPDRDSRTTFLAGGGEMGARMRSMDWAATPLGPPQDWPHSLRTVIRILLTSRFAMWMAWGPELTFFCNDAYLPTTGIKRDWVLGARSDAVWSEIWPDIGPRIRHVLETGEATWDEALLLYLERSGFQEETYHTFSYSPLSDDGGTVVGMLCVVTEVTERVIGERQLATLRDLGARLAAASTRDDVMSALEACLANGSRDLPFAVTYLCDQDRTAAHRVALHGIAPDSPGAAPEIRLADPASPWPLRTALDRAGAVMAPVSDAVAQELPLTFWLRPPRQALIVPIQDAEGSAPLGFLVAGLNPHRMPDESYRGFVELLTGQVAAAVARADAYERERARAEALAEIDRAKTAFFSNVSHEFRTPLTLMLGPLEEILSRKGPPGAAGDRALVEVVHRNGLRLLRLVNALLDFSRIEAGRARAQFVPVDLSRLTRDLASTFRSVCERAGLAFTVDCGSLAQPVHVDRDMWEKIVLNLLSNAFKFTLSGRIEVRLREEDGHVELQVADTGVGIPAQELPRLFERFHRVEGMKGRSFEGSGIGLALVHDLVKLHGGSISVRSEENRGTTFTVALPLGRDHLPADQLGAASASDEGGSRAQAYVEEAMRWLPDTAAADHRDFIPDLSQEPAPNHGSRKARVLLADDNADLRDYVGRLLAGQGYAVDVAPDGEVALEAIRARRPDLVVTDVMMPGLDGFGLLAAIRSHAETAGIPVIMLSARAGEEAQVEGLASGADDYLAKPFSARELLARVSANLEMARIRREAAEAVRASAAQVRRLADAVPAFVYRGAPGGTLLEVNRRWSEYTGHEPDRADEKWGEVIHPEDLPRLVAHFEEALARRAPFTEEFRCRRYDGEYRWFYTMAEPEFGPDGSLIGWLGTSTDIHDRRLAEEAKRAQERRDGFLLALEDQLRPLSDAEDIKWAAAEALGRELDAGRVCYVEVDDEARVCRVARSFTSRGMPDAVGEYSLDRLAQSLAVVRSGRPLVVSDLRADPVTADLATLPEVRRTGVVAALDWPLVKDTRLVGILSVNHPEPRSWSAEEVTLVQAVAERTWAAVERARAEKRLQQLNAELEHRVEVAVRERGMALAQLHEAQKLETIGQLTGGVAHDFNNLLTPIVGALDVLRRHSSGDARAERMLRAAQESAERARILVSRLLSFARRQHLEAQPTGLSELLHGMAELIGRTASPIVEISYRIRQTRPVLVDPNQLELAILNLCVNARDAMPAGGKLVVGSEEVEVDHHPVLRPGRYVRISVEDTGHGMDPNTLQRAIEPFYTTKGIGKGTGLGLSMVHGLAAQSGGALVLESAPGRGTTASIYLPAIEGGAHPAAEEAGPGEVQPPERPLRILLVDDEELVRVSTAEMLDSLGHEVLQAGSGAAALDLLRDNPVDLLVSDHMMPNMTGLGLVAEARKRHPGLQALIITGYSGVGVDGLEGLDRLIKPFDTVELAAAIRSVLDRARQDEEGALKARPAAGAG